MKWPQELMSTNSSEPLKFVFSPTLKFLAQYVLILMVWFFYVKIYIICEKLVFSLDRSSMQIFTLKITRVVWPHVTSLLDLRYFCRHNPLLYHLKLIPGHYWSWQRIISSLVNNFVRHTFSMSKSSIKTETALTMCISVVLSYQPFADVFREVRLLKWPVIMKNFALTL